MRFGAFFAMAGLGMAVIVGVGCDGLLDFVGTGNAPNAQRPSKAPRRCERCAATGAITKTERRPPELTVRECAVREESTGFLGLGDGRKNFTVRVRNDNDQHARTKVRVLGYHERDPNTEIRLHEDDLAIAPHAEGTLSARIANEQLGGVRRFRCKLDPVPVLLQTQSICPVCGGRGEVVQ